MSIYSDYKVGALDEQEFHDLCARENRRELAFDKATYWGDIPEEDEPESEE